MRLKINLTEGKKIRNVFFTSDFHFFHNNVIRFDNRPFKDVYEMNLALENNWNEVISDDDIVIYLGDLSFVKGLEKDEVNNILNRLNGEIHFVLGNHDKYEEIKKNTRFASVSDYLEIRITHKSGDDVIDTNFICMHYPIYSWNKMHHEAIHVHGHTHGNLHHQENVTLFDYYNNRRVIDAGCMLHEYTPINFTKIIDKFEKDERRRN